MIMTTSFWQVHSLILTLNYFKNWTTSKLKPARTQQSN